MRHLAALAGLGGLIALLSLWRGSDGGPETAQKPALTTQVVAHPPAPPPAPPVSAPSGSEPTESSSARVPPGRTAAELAALDPDALLTSVTKTDMSREKADAIVALIDLATFRADVLDRVARSLDRHAGDLETSRWLVGVLARVPTSEAQAALRLAMRRHADNDALLEALVHAHTFARTGSSENVAALLELAADHDQASSLRRAAILAAGAAADLSGDAALKRRVGETLRERAAEASGLDRRAAVAALGNLADPSTAPFLLDELGSDAADIAVAAARALKHIATPETEERLVATASSPAALPVRAAALESLAGRDLAPSAVAALIALYDALPPGDDADQARARLVDALASQDRRQHPELRAFFDRLAARSDTPQYARKQIAEALR